MRKRIIPKLIVLLVICFLLSILYLAARLPSPSPPNYSIYQVKKKETNDNLPLGEKEIIQNEKTEEDIKQVVNNIMENLYEGVTKTTKNEEFTVLLNKQTKDLLAKLLQNNTKEAEKFERLNAFVPLKPFKKTLSEEKLHRLSFPKKLDYSNFVPSKEDLSQHLNQKQNPFYYSDIFTNISTPLLSATKISQISSGSPIVPMEREGEKLEKGKKGCEEMTKMIFYNRIGKAGSSSLRSWIMQYKFNFYVGSSNLYDGANEHLSLSEEELFAHSFSQFYQQKQNFYERHVHFIDFTKYQLEQPSYINMMREPGERYISQFYFWRTMTGSFGDDIRSRNLTVIDCILNPSHDSLYGCPILNYQTSFFCGNSPLCTVPPDEQSFLLARKNLLNFYSVVGTIERFNDTTKLLTKTFPHYFPSWVIAKEKIHLLKNMYDRPPPEIYYMASVANNYDLMLYNLVNNLIDVQLIHCNVGK